MSEPVGPSLAKVTVDAIARPLATKCPAHAQRPTSWSKSAGGVVWADTAPATRLIARAKGAPLTVAGDVMSGSRPSRLQQPLDLGVDLGRGGDQRPRLQALRPALVLRRFQPRMCVRGQRQAQHQLAALHWPRG